MQSGRAFQPPGARSPTAAGAAPLRHRGCGAGLRGPCTGGAGVLALRLSGDGGFRCQEGRSPRAGLEVNGVTQCPPLPGRVRGVVGVGGCRAPELCLPLVCAAFRSRAWPRPGVPPSHGAAGPPQGSGGGPPGLLRTPPTQGLASSPHGSSGSPTLPMGPRDPGRQVGPDQPARKLCGSGCVGGCVRGGFEQRSRWGRVDRV